MQIYTHLTKENPPMKKWLPCLLLFLLLTACEQTVEAPTEATEPPPVEALTTVVTAENIAELENYPALKTLDLTGSTCYAEIAAYCATHPDVEVTYTVKLGSRSAMSSSTTLRLSPGLFDYNTLLENLQYLPALESITFPKTELTTAQLDALRERYPDLAISYTVMIGNDEVSGDAAELDLSWASADEALALGDKLALLTNLEAVNLMDENGAAQLTLTEAAELQAHVPNATLTFTFDLFGKTVTTTDEEITYTNQRIGDDGEAELRAALTVLRGTRLVLDNCKFSDELLAQLRDEYRANAKLVWRVWFGEDGSCLTDREVIRYVYGLTDSNCGDLVYCEDARFLDFGHDEYLTDTSFISGMPNLEAVILSGSMISDLTPFTNCKNLVFLELAYCGYLEDISPLAECTSLTKLNISYTKVSDLSALDNLTMDTFCATHAQVSDEEEARFTQLHADCLTQFSGDQPYTYPWRYSDNGMTKNEYYSKLCEVFNYPNTSNTTR